VVLLCFPNLLSPRWLQPLSHASQTANAKKEAGASLGTHHITLKQINIQTIALHILACAEEKHERTGGDEETETGAWAQLRLVQANPNSWIIYALAETIHRHAVAQKQIVDPQCLMVYQRWVVEPVVVPNAQRLHLKAHCVARIHLLSET
jgi:hypothetical protein